MHYKKINPTLFNKFIFYVVVVVLMSGVVHLYTNFISLGSLFSYKDDTQMFLQEPQNYKFLAFPIDDNVEIYSDETLEKVIGVLDKAVHVNGQEIKDGIVVADLYEEGIGYVKSNSLSFLPPNNDESYLKRKIDISAQYGEEIKWKSSKKSDSLTFIEYSIEDDKHARSVTYSYKTDGVTISKVYKPLHRSGLDVFYILPFLLFLIVLVFMVRKIIFLK